MAEKRGKKARPKGASSDESGVLASLSATRPARLSSRPRGGAAAAAKPKAAASPKTFEPAPAEATPKPAAKKAPKAAAKPARKVTGKPAARSTPKVAATRTTKAAPKAKPAARRKPAPVTPLPLAATDKPRPRPVRPGSPALEETAPPVERPGDDRQDQQGQSGLDLMKTVVQAAGEVAQIGATVGGQIVKRAVDRLPKKP
jgi:hypothetical protein